MGLCQYVVKRSEHEVQRRAKLVACVGEKRALGAVEIGQRVSALAFLFIGARIGYGRCHMASNEMEKIPVLLRRATRRGLIPATKPGSRLLAGRYEGQY